MGPQTTSHSPRTQKNVHDGETSSLEDALPDLDMATPVPPFRRKSRKPHHRHPFLPSHKPRSRTLKTPNQQHRSMDHHPRTQPPRHRPRSHDCQQSPPLRAKYRRRFFPSLSADVGSAVLEIRTVLRRDIERLRMDTLCQFVSFRSEMW
jgi:hypothetical protein